MSTVKTELVSFNPYKWDTGVFSWDSSIADKTWEEAGVSSFSIGTSEDSLIISDERGMSALKQAHDSIQVEERTKRDFLKSFASPLILTEIFYKKFNCGLNVAEAMVIAESLSKAVNIGRQERITVEDAGRYAVDKNSFDTLAVAESLKKEVRYYLYIDEVQRIAEGLSKTYGLSTGEALSLIDEYYRASGMVISDIAFYEREITLDEFKEKDSPAGYCAFKEFIAGDHLYKDAIFKTVLESKSIDASPGITKWQLNIDVPDVFDKGTEDLKKDTSHRVNFNRKFWEIPDVTIKIRGSSDSSAHIKNLVTDIEGFTFDLLDGEDNPIDGVIYWKAEGY